MSLRLGYSGFSVSAKYSVMSQKKTKVKAIRNVLATPFNIKWSESSTEGVISLQKTLKELLPLAKLEKKSLKLPSKDIMKEKIPPRNSQRKPHNNIFRTYLTPGFQSVIRGLEKGELCCVLMSTDISPPMIQRVICSYCNARDISLMTVPELKTITKTALGFPIMVLGLKKCVGTNENPFFPVYEIASENRSSFETPFVAKKNEVKTPQKKEKPIIAKGKSSKPSYKSKVVYLYRQSTDERVFRPENKMISKKQVLDMPKHGMDADFISFNKSGVNESPPTVKAVCVDIKSESDGDSDEDDSLDEENLFFVDNKPDQLNNDSQTDIDMEVSEDKSPQNQQPENSFKTKTKNNERYFSSKVYQGVKHQKVNKKKKKQKHNQLEQIGKTMGKSTEYNPLTIKTIINNPKKIRRKKK